MCKEHKKTNPKLEPEAIKQSEEKGLSFEYVKQILKFKERAADNSIDFPEPPKIHPISENITLYWAENAFDLFKEIMPDLGIPFSPVYTATVSSYSLTKRKIVKSIGCPHTEESPDSIMEYIHGETGNVILIRRELIADLPVQSDLELRIHFEHFFWHELGHFYAINAETNNLHRYNEPGLIDESVAIDGYGYSSEREKKEGYWFWKKFIAEAIANYVSYTIRSSGDNYYPELLDWTVDIWGEITHQLENLLDSTLCYYPNTIDEYSLAYYFSKLLTDNLTILYVKAANEGKLKIYGEVIRMKKSNPHVALIYRMSISLICGRCMRYS